MIVSLLISPSSESFESDGCAEMFLHRSVSQRMEFIISSALIEHVNVPHINRYKLTPLREEHRDMLSCVVVPMILLGVLRLKA